MEGNGFDDLYLALLLGYFLHDWNLHHISIQAGRQMTNIPLWRLSLSSLKQILIIQIFIFFTFQFLGCKRNISSRQLVTSWTLINHKIKRKTSLDPFVLQEWWTQWQQLRRARDWKTWTRCCTQMWSLSSTRPPGPYRTSPSCWIFCRLTLGSYSWYLVSRLNLVC